jgi:carboxypeptidase PM20D1
MNPLLVVPGLGLVMLFAVLLVRTLRFSARPGPVPPAVAIAVDNDKATRRLARALRFRTVSQEDPTQFAGEVFQAFHAWLAEAFPGVHASLQKETVGGFGLLFTWPGSESALRPVLLMAHQDVVPVSPETEPDWTHSPFAGEIADGHVWGRGALDDKSSLMGILEAVEALLASGFQPRRTLYLAFGQDEEIGGTQGAAKIAGLLRSRQVRVEYILDEGGFVAEGLIPGLAAPAALVGIAEKGYLTLELSVAGEGGHSSIPERHTIIGILSKALVRLEENPFPADLSFSRLFFAKVGTGMPFPKRLALANLWLFAPWVEKMLSRSPEMNAGIRTTVAPTQLSAGVKENVLPVRVTAVVNFRVMPGEKTDGVIERVRQVVADSRVEVHARAIRSEPSPVSDVCAASYDMLERTIRQVAGEEELLVAPYLVVGATDCRYYNDLCDNIYRFSFIRVGPEDLKRVHGIDERISVEGYAQLVRFYAQLLHNTQEL